MQAIPLTRLARYSIAGLSAFAILQSALISPIHSLLLKVELLSADVAHLKAQIGGYDDAKN